MTLFVMVQPLRFYLRGLDEKETTEMQTLILENGGEIAVTYSPPIMTFTTQKSHIPGNVEFNIQYIRDCVRSSRVLDLFPYKLYEPGPYDGCLMSLFIYQHGNCKRFIMTSSTSRCGRSQNYTAQEDSNRQMARPSRDAINTMDQFRGIYNNCVAKLGTSIHDDIENRIGSQTTKCFSANVISCNKKRKLSELARESPVRNDKKKMEIIETITITDSSSESEDMFLDSETNMEETMLKMPLVTNDVWITHEDVENLILNDTECPELKIPRPTLNRTQKLLAEESLIGATDERKSDKARASSLSISNIASHRNSNSANVTVDMNDSALSEGGTKVLRTFPRCHQKAEKLDSRTNWNPPVTGTNTNDAFRETWSSTARDQVTVQADAETNDERTDKSKSGKIKIVAMETLSDYNLNTALNRTQKLLAERSMIGARYKRKSDKARTSSLSVSENELVTIPSTNDASRETSSSTSRDQVSVQADAKTNNYKRTVKSKSVKIKNMAIEMSDDNRDSDIELTWHEQNNGDYSPLKDSTVESDIESDLRNERDETTIPRRNAVKTKTQHSYDTRKPGTSAAGRNAVETKMQHTDDTSEPGTSAAGRKKKRTGVWHDVKAPKTMHPGAKFAEWEREAMVKYLIDQQCISQVRGLKVWETMINKKVLAHRTPASLNNHFRKNLIHDVLNYNMPDKAKKEFEKIKQKIMKKKVRRRVEQ